MNEIRKEGDRMNENMTAEQAVSLHVMLRTRLADYLTRDALDWADWFRANRN